MIRMLLLFWIMSLSFERLFQSAKVVTTYCCKSLSPFYEEAEFYNARSLTASGKTAEGKKLLEQIVNKKGFYANQAAEELTKIKP
ncbi:MAG: hypothetical protein IPG39_14220 [Bacteroidetes bacterium]|nr:hypothetical protein [Bacteroidota bacterium]